MVSLVLYVSDGIYYRVFLQLVVRASRGRVYCNEEERRKESDKIRYRLIVYPSRVLHHARGEA